jgi:hypothetical protein
MWFLVLLYDVVVAKCFGHEMLTFKSTDAAFRNLKGRLPEFLNADEHVDLLYNVRWKVKPPIVFHNDVPSILVCREHMKGSKGEYFHPPRNPLVVLPCRLADQVAPAVIRPRTIQQLKPHQYSDSYQMSEMIGQYNGVDTVQICETHDFANESFLLEQYESLTINERPDIANLVRE